MLFNRNDLDSMQLPPKERDRSLEGICFYARCVVIVWASSVYVFTRRKFGREYFGMLEMCSLVLMSGWAAVTTAPRDAWQVTLLMMSFLALSLWHRSRSREVLHDDPEHSKHSGYPWICDYLPIREDVAKSVIEPGGVAMAGWAFVDLSPCLGWFFVIGGCCCVLDWMYLTNRNNMRARHMRNAEKEQQRMNEAYDRLFNNK